MASFSDFYNIYKSTVNTSDSYQGYNQMSAVYENDGTNKANKQKNRPVPHVTASAAQVLKPVKSTRMVVVTPLYKDTFTAFEKRNLANTFRLLGDRYDICVLCPRLLSGDFVSKTFGFTPMYCREGSIYFSGKNSYSRLMERAELYDRFSKWDYILIVQADVWLFNNTPYKIEEYLSKEAVYMGALWHPDYSKTIGIEGVACGNGGLSLRNNRRLAQLLRNSNSRNERLRSVEDQYITYMLYHDGLMTTEEDAFGFSIDNFPEYWMERLGGVMPFGVHMSKPEWKDLWAPYVSSDMEVAGITDEYIDDIPKDSGDNFSKHPDIVVSMTSFGDRLMNDAPVVIQNMLRIQSICPQHIVLSIYREDEKNIPDKLLSLERNGSIEIIRWDENLKSHLKYYPAMLKYPEACIVTVDDDIIYQRDMIKNLLRSYMQHKDCVSALRCHRIKRDSSGYPLKYGQWEYQCRNTVFPSHDLFATGVGGVLYPPGVFSGKMDTEEMKRYITADDIYLKVLEHSLGIKTVCAYEGKPRALMNITSLSARKNRLSDVNTKGQTLNDEYMKLCDLRPETIGKNEAFCKPEEIKALRKVVYTCISGNYDTLDEPRVVTPGWEYICFTDQPFKSKVWDVRPLPVEVAGDAGLTQVKKQRIVKIQPWRFIGDCELCIWVDANQIINGNLDEFVRHNIGDLVTTRHPQRDCIYKESDAIVKYRKDKMENMKDQMELYRLDGYPEKAGLCETSVIIRRQTPEVMSVMDMWEELLRKYSHRDQMSFNYVIWKLGFPLKMFSLDERSRYFKYRNHKQSPRQKN